MIRFGRLFVVVGFVMLVAAAAGCGGTEADEAATQSDAARGGNTSSGASISATPAVYGGYTTLTLYPGQYADYPLTVGINCFQDGVLVLGTPSYELHYAIDHGIAGYAYVGDHYEVVQGPLSWGSYTGGSADCRVFARRHNIKRGSATEIASASFTVSP